MRVKILDNWLVITEFRVEHFLALDSVIKVKCDHRTFGRLWWSNKRPSQGAVVIEVNLLSLTHLDTLTYCFILCLD